MLTYPQFGQTVWNSFVLALGSATAVMLLSATIAWTVVRTKLRGRWLLDNIASMPLSLPGLVLGLAIMVCYLSMDIGIYGTLWIMFIAYLTRFLPYGMRYNSAAMLAIHKELEEFGGNEWRLLEHELSAHCAPAAQTRAGRGFHLCDSRFHPRGLFSLDPAVLARHRSRIHHDMGAVAECPDTRHLWARWTTDSP